MNCRALGQLSRYRLLVFLLFGGLIAIACTPPAAGLPTTLPDQVSASSVVWQASSTSTPRPLALPTVTSTPTPSQSGPEPPPIPIPSATTEPGTTPVVVKPPPTADRPPITPPANASLGSPSHSSPDPPTPIRPNELQSGAGIGINRTLGRLTIEQLAQNSDTIIEAQVIEVGAPRWNTPDHQPPSVIDPFSDVPNKYAIFTPATFNVLTPLKTKRNLSITPGSKFTIYQMGGTVGHFRLSVSNTPDFQIGDMYLLFLSQSEGERLRIPGEYYLQDAYLYKSDIVAVSQVHFASISRTELISRVTAAIDQ